MIVGQRIKARLAALQAEQPELSQAEVARRVGMSQSGMVNLIAGRSRSTTYLHKIARELQTTPAFLTGETDDPDAGALPLAPPPPIRIMMEIVLPPEPALAQMFEALLAGIDPAAPRDEQARLLAQRLPIGLSQLRDLRPASTKGSVRRRERAEVDALRAMPHHEPTQ